MSQVVTHNGALMRITPQQRNRIEISKDGDRIWRLRYEGMMYGEFIDVNDVGTEIMATTTKGVYASNNDEMVWIKRS